MLQDPNVPAETTGLEKDRPNIEHVEHKCLETYSLSCESERSKLTTLYHESADATRRSFLAAASAGLNAPLHRKSLPSMYLYDSVGSDLYQQITTLPEYYLTRTEAEILRSHAAHIAKTYLVPPVVTPKGERSASSLVTDVVELGAGDGHKTRCLLDACISECKAAANLQSCAPLCVHDFEYFPLDISSGALQSLIAGTPQHLRSRTHGVVADNLQGLSWVRSRHVERRTVVLFLGSSIGNYSRTSAVALLSDIRSQLREDDLVLIGFDLRKRDVRQLVSAYDDAAGVTAAFNRNLLSRLNRELGCGLTERDFAHYANWNASEGCMESWLVAQKRVEIPLGAAKVVVEEAEAIHTEVSYKYSMQEIENMAEASGFESLEVMVDERRWFADAVFRVCRKADRASVAENSQLDCEEELSIVSDESVNVTT